VVYPTIEKDGTDKKASADVPFTISQVRFLVSAEDLILRREKIITYILGVAEHTHSSLSLSLSLFLKSERKKKMTAKLTVRRNHY